MQLEFPFGSDPRFPPIRDRLLAHYGPQRDTWRLDVNIRFIEAKLSGCTRDELSARALARVLTSHNSLDDLASCNPADFAKLISDVEFAEQKAIDLLAAINAIIEERGHYDLHFLGNLPVEAAVARLTRFRGFGPKTAAATLNFSDLRMRAFVLDRHVLRILGSVGIRRSKRDFDNGFYKVMPLLPPEWDADDLYELHWLIKLHGQRICRPTRPACGACVLSDLCAHASRHGRS